MVLPGVADAMANPLRPVSILINEDLPTLERPMKAYSWRISCGHLSALELLITKHALLIIISIWIISKKQSDDKPGYVRQRTSRTKQGHDCRFVIYLSAMSPLHFSSLPPGKDEQPL